MNLQDLHLDLKTVVIIVLGCFSVYAGIEVKYAHNQYVQRVEDAMKEEDRELQKQLIEQQARSDLHILENRQKDIERELNRDHFARRAYERDIAAGTATENDRVRHEYLLLKIEGEVAAKEIVDRQVAELRSIKPNE